MKKMLVIMLAVSGLFLMGCSDTMRFPPSEQQKQSAYLGYQANTDIYTNGTNAKSQESTIALQSSQASLSYTGMPKVLPTVDMASTVNQTANAQALQRPTIDETIDYWAALIGGIGGILLIGTPAGMKLAQYLKQLQELRDAKLLVDKKYGAIKEGVNLTLSESQPEQSKVLYENIGDAQKAAGVKS
jgi:hypothetical protein